MRVKRGTPDQEAMSIIRGRLHGLPAESGYRADQATYRAINQLLSLIAAAPEMLAFIVKYSRETHADDCDRAVWEDKDLECSCGRDDARALLARIDNGGK